MNHHRPYKTTPGTQNPLDESCDYCGNVKRVYPVDKLVMHIDNCAGEFICAECAAAMGRVNDRVDKIVNEVMGITPYTEDEMLALKKELDELKIERLRRGKNTRWWRYPNYTDGD